MKKLLLTTVILFSFALIQGQTLEQTLKMVRTALEKERQKPTSIDFMSFFAPRYKIVVNPETKELERIRKPERIKWKNADEVLDYLEPLRFDSLPRMRVAVEEMIYSIGYNCPHKKVRRRAVYDLIEMMPIDPYLQYDINDFKPEDFDKRTKEKIKSILRGEIDSAICELYKYNIKARLRKKSVKEHVVYIAKIIAQKDSLPFEEAYRQAIKKEFDDDYNYFCNSERISFPELFILVGRLYMYEFIPEMEAMLKDPRYTEKEKIKLALARLGIEKYIEENLTGWWPDYTYLNCQKSIKIFIKEYLNTDEIYCCDGECLDSTYVSYGAYLTLERWIKNFPKRYYINKKDDCSFSAEEIKKYEQGKRWINEHIDKLKLNRDMW